MNNGKFVLNSETLADFRHQSEAVIDVLCRSFGQENGFSGAKPEEVFKSVSELDVLPKKGIGFDKALSLIESKVLPDMLKVSLFGIMAHLHTPVLLESIAAETIIGAYNQSMDSWDQAPSATEVEISLIKRLAALYGYPAGSDGTFTSGGTQSNLQACIIARDKAFARLGDDVRKAGLQGSMRRMRIYASEIAHFSFSKSAHILGMGYDSVRLVPVNGRMQMDVAALEKAVEEDVEAGFAPCMVAATVGTTDFGSIDDLAAISAICRKYGMHFHADAAYGSACVLSRKYKGRVENLKLCDSITIDFHKMFLLPISCSCILVKNARDFDCLSFHSDYLNREEDEGDGYDNLVGKSLLTTRRSDCMKVLMAFMVRGEDGLDEMVTAMMDNARYFYGILNASDMIETLNEPELTSVVFRRLPKDKDSDANEFNKKLRRWLMHEKKMIIGQTTVGGDTYLKFTLLNPSLKKGDFDRMLSIICGF
ncbi:MAG TPA: diaminobutyrate decarboxylase [Spirochaetaceae bacterium]|nr:diaminobutyrate decarboxylase [Spirochaetaceae bacterium]